MQCQYYDIEFGLKFPSHSIVFLFPKFDLQRYVKMKTEQSNDKEKLPLGSIQKNTCFVKLRIIIKNSLKKCKILEKQLCAGVYFKYIEDFIVNFGQLKIKRLGVLRLEFSFKIANIKQMFHVTCSLCCYILLCTFFTVLKMP